MSNFLVFYTKNKGHDAFCHKDEISVGMGGFEEVNFMGIITQSGHVINLAIGDLLEA